jgi:hypothetical protein
VVIAVVDGVRDTEFFEEPTHQYIPHVWNELCPLGYVGHAFYNWGLTKTNPGHATIATGNFELLDDQGLTRPVHPTLWEYYRDFTHRPDHSAILVTLKDKLLVLSYSTAAGYGAVDSCFAIGPTWNDSISVARFLTYAAQYRPVISFIALGEIDAGGHSGDWNRYIGAITRADVLIHRLYAGIQSVPGFNGHTTFFLTADHGRHVTDWCCHGDNCYGCRHLPFLAIGPDFVSGVESWYPNAEQRDICATAGLLLGISTPQVAGRVMTELFINPDAVSDAESPSRAPRIGPGPLRIIPSPARQGVVVRLSPEMDVMGDDPGLASDWGASVVDAQGRQIWGGLVSGKQLADGWTLTRPPRWIGTGQTWLRLRALNPAALRQLVGEILWLR